MEFQRIGKNTVQCHMSVEEMQEYGFAIEDFFTDQEKSREFLEQLVERAEEEVGYEVESGMVSMQLMKMPDESLVITFSDRSEEGIQGMMEQLHNLTEMIGEDGELTPEDMENLDKSDGGDNLNLIFKVLKRGDKLTAALNTGDPKQLSDMGLRYDLTLPLSRYYAANKDKLPNPFKVIQTDRVFRAERPQKGRLREFVQCDIDILGDASPNAEVELIDVTTRALLNIGFTGFTVNINDRRILRGMLESMGFAADTLDSVCITFDKMDKIGAEGVKAELAEKQLPESAIHALADFIAAGDVTLDAVAARCADPAIADDLKYVLATANTLAAGRYQVAYCPSLVRGQGYYTGMVFEVTCPQFSGAVAGGGRYDNMVGKFLGVQVPAVGFSIGFERVCGILLEQGYQIPGAKQKIALLYGKDTDFPAVLRKAAVLREQYNVTVLPQGKKLGKQLGQLEAAGFAGAAFMDKDEVKIFAQQ